MVGDDPHGDVVGGLAAAVPLARHLLDGGDQVAEQVGVVVGALALGHRGHALQPGAGVDGGLGQRGELPVGAPLELHEDQVPDLQPAVAVAGHALARPAGPLLGAGDVVPLEVVDLGAGAAGAGVAHGPEVVLGAELVDPVGRDALRLPEVEGLLVPGQAPLAVEDGGRQPRGVEAEPPVAGDELPAPGDGVLLEVVAEGEVAQHLEEGVVPRGEAHVLEVVVLAAGAHALLGGGGAGVVALLPPGEDVLELDHARVGEEQGRVVLGDEGGGGDAAVAALLEEAEEGLADLGGGEGLHGVFGSGHGGPGGLWR